MSEHDDTLLDEDLGDEEYDLGNDEEEALLADDYELERQSSYKGEEETDDVLDLGVTDALDDLEGEDENIEFSRSRTDNRNANEFYQEGEHRDSNASFYEKNEPNEYNRDKSCLCDDNSICDNVSVSNNIGKGDLREKLQKNVQKVYVREGQGLEDEDGEKEKERRNRFQTERTMISPKMNNEIPDTLENVVTSEALRPLFRSRGRGRGIRGNNRGARFNLRSCGSFNPRFTSTRNTTFDVQQPICRPPLLEGRPAFLIGMPNAVPNQQILYHQSNAQAHHFQQFAANGVLQGPTHFVDKNPTRPHFNSTQFQSTTGPRLIGQNMDFGSRASASGSIQGPVYNGSQNQPPYLQIQAGPFQNTGAMMQDNSGRSVQSNQVPIIHGNTGGPLLGNPNPSVSGNPTLLLQGNTQPLQIQGFPRQQTAVSMQPSQIQNHSNSQISGQPTFDSRPSFQSSQFDARSSYSEQGSSNQFDNNINNSNVLPLSQQPGTSISNVSLPSGHKILINPHFRGPVQSTNDARLVWDSVQYQSSQQSQISGGAISHSAVSSYNSHGSYNQFQHLPGSAHYQRAYQQTKNDDPYAYFSDVWQENRPQKLTNICIDKEYASNSNFSRESNYTNNGNKYKADNQWGQRDSYQEASRDSYHQNYRDLPVKPRSGYLQKPRACTSSLSVHRETKETNSCANGVSSGIIIADSNNSDMHDKSKKPSGKSIIPLARDISRPVQKRVFDISQACQQDTILKRPKSTNRNLQEIQMTDTLKYADNEKKDDDSDPEMQEYRQKMEEQKRLREKILREKENRRKKAAMEMQNELKNESITMVTECMQQEKHVPIHKSTVTDGVTNKTRRTNLTKGRDRPILVQTAEVTERASGMRIVRTVQTEQLNELLGSDEAGNFPVGHVTTNISDAVPVKHLTSQTGTRRVILQKSLLNSQRIATTVHKTVTNLQKGQLIGGTVQNTLQKVAVKPSGSMKKISMPSQIIGGHLQQRGVNQKTTGNQQKSSINMQNIANANAQKIVVNTQSNQRIVLEKPLSLQSKISPDIKTNTVKLENLAASTSENQIRRMCQGIGTIESIHMGEGSATIVFKTQSAATLFHKKYQRKMLDLSLITVRLVPQASGK